VHAEVALAITDEQVLANAVELPTVYVYVVQAVQPVDSVRLVALVLLEVASYVTVG